MSKFHYIDHCYTCQDRSCNDCLTKAFLKRLGLASSHSCLWDLLIGHENNSRLEPVVRGGRVVKLRKTSELDENRTLLTGDGTGPNLPTIKRTSKVAQLLLATDRMAGWSSIAWPTLVLQQHRTGPLEAVIAIVDLFTAVEGLSYEAFDQYRAVAQAIVASAWCTPKALLGQVHLDDLQALRAVHTLLGDEHIHGEEDELEPGSIPDWERSRDGYQCYQKYLARLDKDGLEPLDDDNSSIDWSRTYGSDYPPFIPAWKAEELMLLKN